MVTCIICVSLWEASYSVARVTASASMVKLEIMTVGITVLVYRLSVLLDSASHCGMRSIASPCVLFPLVMGPAGSLWPQWVSFVGPRMTLMASFCMLNFSRLGCDRYVRLGS